MSTCLQEQSLRVADIVPFGERGAYDDVVITPDVARLWLATRNKRNRPIKKDRVAKYAEIMLLGKWLDSGHVFVFDSDGQLMNGQHRLLAIIKSGITMVATVITGRDPTAMSAQDTNAPRRASDNWIAVKNASGVQATVKLAWQHDQDLVSLSVLGASGFAKSPSNPEIEETFHKYPDIPDFVRNAKNIAAFPSSVIAFVAWAGCRDGRFADREREWFDGLRTGANLKPGSPILCLRWWHRNKNKNRRAQIGVAIKAWNAFVSGKSITLLRFNLGSSQAPASIMPRILGFNYDL